MRRSKGIREAAGLLSSCAQIAISGSAGMSTTGALRTRVASSCQAPERSGSEPVSSIDRGAVRQCDPGSGGVWDVNRSPPRLVQMRRFERAVDATRS